MRLKTALANIVTVSAIALSTLSCANIGTPEGGPRDYAPPVMVNCNPQPGTVNFKGDKVVITFDEIINVKDQYKKVIISPAPKEQPAIRPLGKKITIEFREDLLPATTYVIDFSNSIEDNNEGNVLDGFAIAFSTGDEIDSLRVSGMVLQAKDLEPMQHVFVGVHKNLDDSAFSTLPFDRLTRTNDRGEFTLLGLEPGKYRIYALNDVDGDYKLARTEDCAWIDDIIVPTVGSYQSTDTTFTFDHRIDTVRNATHIEYLPNNILLSMFNENYKSLYIRQTERPADNRLQVLFSAPSPQLPQLSILSPARAGNDWYSLERRADNDSLVYWLKDSTLIKCDSIVVAMRHLFTDSTDNLSWKTDTITFAYRKPNSVIKEETRKQKEREKRQAEIAKLQQRRDRLVSEGKDTEEVDEQLYILHKADSVPKPTLKLDMANGSLGVDDSIAIKTTVPIGFIDNSKIHLSRFVPDDSTWLNVAIPSFIVTDSCSQMRWVMPMKLEEGQTYRFTVDNDAVKSIYDIGNDSTTINLKVKSLDEYANLYLNISGLAGRHAFVELLDQSDKPIRKQTVDPNGRVSFINVEAGTYYARLVLDLNNNDIWDTGNYAKHLQPEDVFYFPAKLKLRKNWDVEQVWNIYATAVNLQKPDDIKHNRPEERKNLLDKKDKKKKTGEDDEEEDEFSTGFGGRRSGTYSGDKYRDSRNRTY